MAASLTIYLLEQLTDYSDFERLCHDLMALEGFPKIEPLGGFKDKGRDAIHVDKSGETTIFAYSVREDWQAKLAEDATKIKNHNHKCDKLVFISTAEFTAGERDQAVARTLSDFGFALDLYGLERLRVLLDTKHPQIKFNHPQIFPPEFLQIQDKLKTAENKKHLFLSFAPADRIFAEWLTRKLTAEGYLVWCESYKILGGERYPNDVNSAIKNETFRMIALYSNASLVNAEVMRQRALALNIGEDRGIDFVIPIRLENFDASHLDRETSTLAFVPFENNWAKGLKQILEKLKSINCPRPLADGKLAATEVFFEKDVLSEEPEQLYTNCFAVESIPKAIYKFEVKEDFFDSEKENFSWAYRKLNDREVFSFHHPPGELIKEYNIKESGGYSWQDVEKIEWTEKGDRKWILAVNLVSELIRKSLIAKCHQKGLKFSPDTELHHFPYGLLARNRLPVILPEGKKIPPLAACGEKKFFKPKNQSEYYKYHLAPTFFIRTDLFQNFVALVRIRIHLTDQSGAALPSRKINSRRKHLCKSWWNDNWFKRILAVVQFLSENEKIIIGDIPKEQIVLSSHPLSFGVSGGIREAALEMTSYERESLFLMRDDEDEDEAGGTEETK
jgi:hypothetical protein